MAVAKVIELLVKSEKGWEDAAHLAVAEAAKTVRNIKEVYVSDMQAEVENNKVVRYKINAKITFVVD